MASARRAVTLTLQRLIRARSRLPALQASQSAFIDPLTFSERHLSFGRPGLFRGLTSRSDSPYLWPAHEQWTGGAQRSEQSLDGLRKIDELQNAVVDVEVAPVGRGYGDGVRGGSLTNNDAESWAQVRMPFAVFHDAFIDGAIPWSTNAASGEDAHAHRMIGYVAQQDLFEVAPALRHHCPPLPHTTAGKRGSREQWRRNVWIGSAGTFTPLHCDPYENMFVQVVGVKRLHLFPPQAREALYMFDARSTQQPNTSSISSELPLLQETDEDVDAVQSEHDIARWPLLDQLLRDEKVSGHHAVLQPGDAIYIPEGWFHCVTSLTPSASVNAWFR